MDLMDLESFVRVGEGGSFTRAAQSLGVPKSTVSRRVARLEDALGLSLLLRKGRSVTFTEHGRQLFERSAPLLKELGQLERALGDARGEPQGVLRLSAPPDLGSTQFFARLLSEFQRRWPKVSLEVELTSRYVDLLEEGFDLVLRPHGESLPDTSTLMMRSLGTINLGVYASPGYLKGNGQPRSPHELVRHRCLTLRAEWAREVWSFKRPKEPALRPFPIQPALWANDFSLLVAMALAGGGIALLPWMLAEPYVQQGELVPLLRNWSAGHGRLSLVWPSTRHLLPKVRAFIDHFTQHLEG